MDPEADGPSSEEAERTARIAELEARLANPAPLGVRPIAAALGLVLCGVALFIFWADTRYYFSAKTPVQLGAEGDYRFELARDNTYVELHGVPTSRGAFGVDDNTTVVAIGVRDTPVMVWRKALRGEEWAPGKKPPPPNQQPFTVRGRLLARADSAGDTSKFRDAFEKLDGFGEVNAKWVLLESEKPGTNFAIALFTTVLGAFAGFLLWLLVRGLVNAKKLSRPAA